MKKTKNFKPYVIFINGPSSSGKTTLAKAIQEHFSFPFLHVSLDKMIGMMPAKLNNWEGKKADQGFSWKKSKDLDGVTMHIFQKGIFAEKICASFKKVVLALLEQGHYIIIDDVAFGKQALEEWRKVLKGYLVIFVGLKVSLSVLEKREKERKNRIIGSARAQYYSVHEEASYDLEFDTASEPLESILAKIQKKVI
ncbi:MAG: AAA family ATPase [Chlamydiae bacterium]|nr:AAA family ATPase [Chlamydiota bacterium]